MSAIETTVGLTWTLIADLSGKFVKNAAITRESLQTMEVIYGPPVPAESAEPEWIVTDTAFGIETWKIPSGGQMYARMTEYEEVVVVNYD